jgi:hypothetical protein
VSPTLLFVLLALTAFRITRLITRDEFPPVAVARERVAGRYGDESWQAYLARCPWCVGVYVSAGCTFLTWLAVGGLPLPLLWWGATAAVVGMTAKADGALDRD